MDDVELFIQKFNIKEGEHRVYNWQIYWHFKKTFKKVKMSQREFNKRFAKKFQLKRLARKNRKYGNYCYKLNMEFGVPYAIKEKHRKKGKQWEKTKKLFRDEKRAKSTQKHTP